MSDHVLVTGAAGFVGAALCETLRATGVPTVAASRKSGEGVLGVGDVGADTDWSLALNGCHAIVHLAARVHVMHETTASPIDAFRRTNLDGTVTLAKQALLAGVRRFVYVSSIKVNGEQTFDEPFTATSIPNPQDPYGVSKWEAEQALRELCRGAPMELAIVRPPLVYGPGVLANFRALMGLVRRGVPIPLGAVDNRRSMVGLANLCDLLIECVRNPAASGRTFLVSDDESISTAQLIRLIANEMQRPARIWPMPLTLLRGVAGLAGKSDVLKRLTGDLRVDITHTRTVLGWSPPVSLQEGLAQTVRAYLSAQPDKETL